MPDPTLQNVSAAILTASDRCAAGVQVDRSGPALQDALLAVGMKVLEVIVSPDDKDTLSAHLSGLTRRGVPLILTTGGTGLSPRDNTPEATLAVVQRQVPGLAEHLRRQGLGETPFAVLSRGICGIAEKSLIVNLPGSPAGALNGLRTLLPLLPHALNLIAGNSEHPSPAG